MNNRKRTKGRIIQSVRIPLFVTKLDKFGSGKSVPNDHPKVGKVIQIKHNPPIK